MPRGTGCNVEGPCMDTSITIEQPAMAGRAQRRLALGTSLPGRQEPGEPAEGCRQAVPLAPHARRWSCEALPSAEGNMMSYRLGTNYSTEKQRFLLQSYYCLISFLISHTVN